MAIELSALAYMMTASVARHSEMTANFETISFQLFNIAYLNCTNMQFFQLMETISKSYLVNWTSHNSLFMIS